VPAILDPHQTGGEVQHVLGFDRDSAKPCGLNIHGQANC
jgi:hypothetical protein